MFVAVVISYTSRSLSKIEQMNINQHDKNITQKDFKGCDRNINETKIDIRHDYAHNDSTMTHIPTDGGQYNTSGSVIGPLGSAVTNDYR